jgi:hypothetical protein
MNQPRRMRKHQCRGNLYRKPDSTIQRRHEITSILDSLRKGPFCPVFWLAGHLVEQQGLIVPILMDCSFAAQNVHRRRVNLMKQRRELISVCDRPLYALGSFEM